ncbi:MAG: hypothetical protein DRK00_01745 [Thermoprotei archaeon]|nr:MAG: hypothetical protein DRK00_01745 [Thermoprotei archaeon]
MVAEALILAAGLGTRLGALAKGAKFSVEVRSRPLISYPLTSLLLAGVERIHVVVNPSGMERLERVLASLGYADFVNVVVNEEPWRENGYSLLVGASQLDADSFFVSMSDHIYPIELPMRLREVAEAWRDAAVVVAGDRAPSYINVREATLIDAGGGLEVKRIGKSLERWDFVDAGVFIMRREVIRVAREIACERDVVKLSDIVNAAVERGMRAVVADITGIPWTEVDTPEDYFLVNSGPRSVVVEEVIRGWSGR